MAKLEKRGTCKTCNHPDRARIELRCANGQRGCRRIAKEFGLPHHSVWRHWTNHVSDERKARMQLNPGFAADLGVDLETLKRGESEGALQFLVNERTRLMRIADHCEDLRDYPTAVKASAGVQKVLELIAKLLGDLKVGSTTINQNFLYSPDWVQLRSVIARSLRPFPDAQRAVLDALREHEQLRDGTQAIEVPRPALEHSAC